MRKKQVPTRKVRRKMVSYEHATLLAAWDAVKGGMTVYQASQLFGIPSQTLRDRKKGRILSPEGLGAGRHPAFPKANEQKLVDHIKYLTSLGYGCSRSDVVKLATDYLQYLGILPSHKRLTGGWFKRCEFRWPELKTIRQRGTGETPARYTKGATPEELQTYFSELKSILDRYDFHTKPHCIYYVEETAIISEPDKVFAMQGNKSIIVSKDVTVPLNVVACGNASGSCLPPFLIFKGKKKKSELSDKYSEGTEVRMSESGWSNSQLLTDFVKNHFVKCSMKDDSEHKLLLYDAHTSHINVGLIDWAREHNVILFLLPPSSKHIARSSDIGCFEQFKTILYDECEAFMTRNDTDSITKYDLGGIVCMVYPKALSAKNLVSSFQRTGIHPFKMFSIESTLVSESPVSNGHSVGHSVGLSIGHSADSGTTDGSTNAEEMTENSIVVIKKLKKKKTVPPLKIRKVTQSGESEPVASSSKTRTFRKRRKAAEVSSDSDTSADFDISEEEKCCVCGHFEPDSLKHHSCLHLVNWAQCESCDHWVHLKFCVPQKAVRRHSNFVCPHCE